MKIVIGVHHFPPRHTGGGEREAQRFAFGLAARGHEVRVVCVERIDEGPAGGVAWNDEVVDGYTIRRLRLDLRLVPDRSRWEYDNPWIGDHLRGLLAQERPDVFLLIGGYLLSGSVLAAARAERVPALVRLTDFWFLCPRIILQRSDGSLSPPPIDPSKCARCLAEESRRYRIPGRLFPSLARAFWRLRRKPARRIEARLAFLREQMAAADALISPSQFLLNTYIAAGAPRESLYFLRQGVEVPAAISAPPPPPSLRLAYLGQIAPLKGVDVLLRAIRLLPEADLRLDVYGDLDFFPEYAATLRGLAGPDGRIQLRGRYPVGPGPEAVLRETHAVVVPSTWYENSPNAILESFANAVPVIASDLGGMAELVRHEESGLLFRPGNAAGLAAQIDRLVREPSLLPVLRSGIPPMKSVAEEIDEIEAFCDRAIASRGRGSQ